MCSSSERPVTKTLRDPRAPANRRAIPKSCQLRPQLLAEYIIPSTMRDVTMTSY